MKNLVCELAEEFSSQSHGTSDYWKDTVYVRGEDDSQFVPLAYILKKADNINGLSDLQSEGYVMSSLDFLKLDSFGEWYQKSFNRKLFQKDVKNILIVHFPDQKKIFEAIEIVDQVFKILKDHKVLINGKNIPVQLGEWYAKTILGLKQVKSSSQRGFDFLEDENKKVEIKIQWQNQTSPKGVKLKRSLVELSDYTVVMYMAKDFKIREILFLDSSFIIRKFAGKGHTIFLKDPDVRGYFFSKSSKHYNRIRNKSALMRFATPELAMKIDEKIEKDKAS